MSNPCLEHNCSKCCYKTEMTLTNEDVERILKLGYKDFYIYKNGYLQLENVHGHCYFLKKDLCSIYDDRPEGCKLYPQVFDLDSAEVYLHEFCPYNDEFEFSEDDARRLEEVIALEERERNERILKRLHELSG
ncbi:MAG: YkgJ family cysteine cluster protein [Thermoplasmata archaeon]|nr:MAG: YkgJ family cysteine cluster protein [Thermoplasmata archaeon]